MGKQGIKVNSQRTRYAKELKLEAVRVLEQGDKTGTQLTLELGVARNQLYKWQEQLRTKDQDNAFRGPEDLAMHLKPVYATHKTNEPWREQRKPNDEDHRNRKPPLQRRLAQFFVLEDQHQ